VKTSVPSWAVLPLHSVFPRVATIPFIHTNAYSLPFCPHSVLLCVAVRSVITDGTAKWQFAMPVLQSALKCRPLSTTNFRC
jgi:hypothetical protein